MTRLCEQFDLYSEGRLAGTSASAFEHHLAECQKCHGRLHKLNRARAKLATWGKSTAGHEPSEGQVHALVRRVSSSPPARARRSWVIATAALATAALAVVLWSSVRPRTDARPLELALLRGESASPLPPIATAGTKLLPSTSAPLVVLLGRDRVGVSPAAASTVLSAASDATLLSLERGRIACRVEPGQGRQFMIEAGSHRIIVTGTRFEVERLADRIRVAVSEGTVRLTSIDAPPLDIHQGEGVEVTTGGSASTHSLSSSESMALESLLRGESSVASPAESSEPLAPARMPEPPSREETKDRSSRNRAPQHGLASDNPIQPAETVEAELAKWREAIARGETEKARDGLHALLERNKDQPQALLLLAGCERRLGHFAAATVTYSRLFDAPDPALQNRARFLAAAVFQDQLHDPTRAAELLERFVSVAALDEPLAGDAWVRLARAYVTKGDQARARAALQRVLERHPGTPAALEARKLQKQIEGESRP